MEGALLILVISFFVLVIISFYMGKTLGKRYMFEVMSSVMEKEKKSAVNKSRAVLKGQFSEQLSPFSDDFPIKPSEARFLGAPIDFIGFVGLDERHVSEVVFIEVKSGKSQMNATEKSIRDAIKNKRVRFEEFRIN